MCSRHPQSSVIGLLHFSSEDGFEMTLSIFFLHAGYVHFLLQSPFWSSIVFFIPFSGPTPVHAPRPRPITHSIGIGFSEFGSGHVDVSTQGGPPQLDFSAFLQDLSLTGMSSPPVSVLSPVLRRSFAVTSPPPARVTLCQGTSTRDEVEYVEVATETGISNADKAVQAVVDGSDVGTVYDPPAMIMPVVPTLEDAVLDIELAAIGSTSLNSLESSVDPPDDFTVDGSLAARSELGDAGPASASGPEETSSTGASLIDSDDEPIISFARLLKQL